MRARYAALACALALAQPALAADEYEVVSHCGWQSVTEPGDDLTLVLIANAHATGPTPAATTTVTCTVTNRAGESLTSTGSSIGSDVVAVSGRIMSQLPPEYCVSSYAVWIDPASGLTTHEEYEDEHCEEWPT